MMLVERWRLLLADESGFTLPELLTSMAIMLTIMAGFTGLLVSTSRAELDMNNRFQARTEARLGLSRLRREVHCASPPWSAAGSPATRATLTLNAACPTAGAGTTITWCTVANGTGRYGLWRYIGAACSGTGVKVADYLTTATPFTYTAQTTHESRTSSACSFDVNLTPVPSLSAVQVQRRPRAAEQHTDLGELMKLLRNERGFALPLALLVMVTTSAILVTAIKTTSSTRSDGQHRQDRGQRRGAGRGRRWPTALSILAKPGQNTNTQALFPSTEATATRLHDGERHRPSSGASTTRAPTAGRCTRRGSLPNPTGGAPVTKTLSRTARCSESRPVQRCPSGAASSTTTRTAASRSTPSRFPGPSPPRGPMCLVNGGNVAVNSTGAATTVGVGTNLTVDGAARCERLALPRPRRHRQLD